MTPQNLSEPDLPVPPLPSLRVKPSSASGPSSATITVSPTTGAQRRIAIAVDLSDESAYAVKWAVNNYLRPSDAVILLHVRPTSVLYGADWGSIQPQINHNSTNDHNNPVNETDQQQLEDDFNNFTTTKANSLAQPLLDAQIPFKIHIVQDHDMKERLCLEVERLGLSAVIMGSRGFGAAGAGRRNSSMGRLGSVSDYCVHHCVCPVVVVRSADDDHDEDKSKEGSVKKKGIVGDDVAELHPVPEEDQEEYHDASDEQKGY